MSDGEDQDQDSIWGTEVQGGFLTTPVSYTNYGLKRRWLAEQAESVFGAEYRHWSWCDDKPIHQEVHWAGVADFRKESGSTVYADGSREEWIEFRDQGRVSYHGHIMDRVRDDRASEVDLRKRELRRADPSGV